MSRHRGEPHPPRFGWLLLKGLLPDNHCEDILGDLEEQYQDLEERRGVLIADLWFTVQVPLNLIASLTHKIFWALVYFRDDLRLAWRHVKRNRLQTATNVIGLLAGLACSLVIILYTVSELTYDRQQPHADRLYRIIQKTWTGHRSFTLANTEPPVVSRIRANFPQVELATVVVAPYENRSNVLVQVGEDSYFNSHTWFVEPQFLDMFDMKFLRGSKETALREPHSVLLSRSWAEKLFGTLDVIGKTVNIEIDYEFDAPREDFLVTGVVEDSPLNTHLKGELWISHATLEQKIPNLANQWRSFRHRYTYIRLREGVNLDEFVPSLRAIPEEFGQAEPPEGEQSTERFTRFRLQPVTDIHMGLPVRMNPEPMGNMTYIYVYASIALLVLLVACMNFIHLAATLSLRRAHEFSVRRAFGARRIHMNGQLLTESLLITFLALAGSIALVQIILPFFNRFSGRELTLMGLLHPYVLLILLGLFLLVVLGAGLFPAAIHSISKPIDLLHGRLGSSRRKTPGQRLFIMLQLSVLTFLLICTLIVRDQLSFMKGQSLGFEKEQRVVLKVKSDLPGFHRRYDAVREAFAANPSVASATVSSSVPGEQSGGYYMRRLDIPDFTPVYGRVFTVDPYFSQVFGIEVVEGRVFDPEKSDEENHGYVINESLLKALGYSTPEEAIGEPLVAHYHGQEKPVIGVISDFHYSGMQEEVLPLLLDMENSLMSCVTVTFRAGQIRDGMAQVQKTWTEQFSGIPFEYRFVDDIFDAQYRYEDQAGRLLTIVTTVTILIALMGLIGLVTSIVQQRRAEIGIRKVLGASQLEILTMLSRSFVLLALFSGVVAIPAAWWTLRLWLENFAYHIPLTLWRPLQAVILVLLLTLGMMVIQGYRTSRINPATVIREE